MNEDNMIDHVEVLSLIEDARANTACAMSYLREAMLGLDTLMVDHPGEVGLVEQVLAQLRAMEGLARDLERKLAENYDSVRVGARRG